MTHGPERDRLLDALHRRASALAKLTRPGHPGRSIDAVLAHTAENCFGTAAAVLGEALQQRFLEVLYGDSLESHGICRFCAEHALDRDLGMCRPCWDREEREDREAEALAAMDAPPQGGVS